MNFTKLSAIAMCTIGLGVLDAHAADTLASMFQNGTINGELKAYYFEREEPC